MATERFELHRPIRPGIPQRTSSKGISPATASWTWLSRISFPLAISILLGNGDGTFQPARTVGDLDTILPRRSSPGTSTATGSSTCAVTGRDGGLEILLGNGDGTFEPAEPVSIPTRY